MEVAIEYAILIFLGVVGLAILFFGKEETKDD